MSANEPQNVQSTAANAPRSASCDRRAFLRRVGAASAAVVAGAAFPGAMSINGGTLRAAPPATALASSNAGAASTPESLVKVLYDSLNEKQRKAVCFDWNHIDKTRGLLRTRLENNWRITAPIIKSDAYTKDQQALMRQIFEGMTNPAWLERWDRQLNDDVGGFGSRQSIAIFGTPGTNQFEFVLASRHMTLRCDGNSADHVAFGGPILYAHDPSKKIYEQAAHPGNVFWHQAVAANQLYGMFDGKQREQALIVKGMPTEEKVGFKGKGPFQGIRVADLSKDQKAHLQGVMKMLLGPFRASDVDEAVACLNKQGGLDACSLCFYKEGDLGDDGIYDNWRLEGPSFVWYFRGRPHVHVWVNIADDPSVELNAYQNSIL